MPRFTTSEQWLAGYISGRRDELRRTIDKLRSTTAFSRDEMAHMRSDVLRLDEAVRPQWRDVRPQVVRPMRRQYEELLQLALDELARRERNEGLPSGESAAMYEYRRRSEEPNIEGYESDGRHEQPLEDWTMLVARTGDRADNADDLRRILERRRVTGSIREGEPPRPGVPSVVVRPFVPRVALAIGAPLHGGQRAVHAPLYGDDRAGPSRRQSPGAAPPASAGGTRPPEDRCSLSSRGKGKCRPRRPSPTPSTASTCSSRSMATNAPPRSRRSSTSSVRSQFSYQSRYTHAPGDDAPPIARELPVPIDQHDPSIIGRAELFCHPPERGAPCVICGSLEHRACHCSEFGAMSLQHRWYRILSAGACLHCLRRGHSSGYCGDRVPCKCGILHNSLLCNRFVVRRR